MYLKARVIVSDYSWLPPAARRPLPAARCRAASMAHNPDG